MGLEISSNTIKFYEKKGIQFFERFRAVNKHKNPVNVFMTEQNAIDTIKITDLKERELGSYQLIFQKEKASMEGKFLYADVPNENHGQLLTLSALIEFSKNRLNHFNLFSFKESIPYHARYGFLLDNDDPDYILNVLKQIIKSKLPHIETFQQDAKFFHTKIQNSTDQTKENQEILQNSCRVISDYLRYLSRRKMEKFAPDFEYASNVTFSDWEFETNRKYLNKLLKKHEIDYKF